MTRATTPGYVGRIGRNVISLSSSADRPPADPDSGREAGAAGSSGWHSHDEGGPVSPAASRASTGDRSPAAEFAASARGAQQPAGQTRLEQQLLTAFRAAFVAVWAVASRPNDSIATTAASAIKTSRKLFERRVIWISWPDYLIFHTPIIIRQKREWDNCGDRRTARTSALTSSGGGSIHAYRPRSFQRQNDAPSTRQ